MKPLRFWLSKLDVRRSFRQRLGAAIAATILLFSLLLAWIVGDISLGVATCLPSATINPVDLISAADGLLYQAKQQGRDRALGLQGSPSHFIPGWPPSCAG